MNKDHVARAWVAQVLDASSVREVRSLSFGIISDVRLLDVDGELIVLRRYTADWTREHAHGMVEVEAIALTKAARVFGKLVPKPLATDPYGSHAGWPALLMTFLPGSAVIGDLDLRLAAAALTQLHTAEVPSTLGQPHGSLDREQLAVPAWTQKPRAWTTVIELLEESAPSSPNVFLHQDYHPGNLLWQHGQLTGIVDWAGASQEPAAIDVAHMRTNLALVEGPAQADVFLHAYIGLNPAYRHHPSWDAGELIAMMDNDFAGVLAFNAFGTHLTAAQLRARADAFADTLSRIQ